MEVPTVSVKDMLPFQRPREKFLALGPSHMAMEELLAILLRTGVKGQSAISLASDIVQSYDDGAYGLNRMTVEELVKIKGIGTDKAVTLCAALEMGRRLGENQGNIRRFFSTFCHCSICNGAPATRRGGACMGSYVDVSE